MTYETILVDHEDGVGIVTLNRPEKLNAMNRKLGQELHHAVKALEADDGLRDGRGSYEIGSCSKPTIGMMNGLAYGGASVLASSLDMRVGCEGSRFRFLAAAYGRINSTWTLGNQVGWPKAKELLFSARVVEPEEAFRIGLLNHLVPRAELREKTMWLAKMIAGNHRGAVMGVKALLIQQLGEGLERQWVLEQDYTTTVMRGAKARDAFPEFIARKGIQVG